MEKAEYTCSSCKFKFKKKYTGWYPTTECKKCGGLARYSDQDSGSGAPYYKKHKDMVAQGVDSKTGEPFWLDKKGKRVKYYDSSIRYDVAHDPRGWKSTGTKVKYKGYGEGGKW